MCKYIKSKEKDRYAAIEKTEKKEYYRLSSAQKRLYLLHGMEVESTVYNIPAAVILEGILEKAKLEDVFKKLIHRHESLRTSFELVGDSPVQRVHEEVEFEVEYYGAERMAQSMERNKERCAPGAVRCASFIRPFDLSQAPLLRVVLQKTAEFEYILTVDMHHIISDGTSLGVLVKEFMYLYHGDALPPLRTQYKDFTQWQSSRKEKEAIKKQEEYWLKEFAGEIPVLNLPLDFARPAIQDFTGSTLAFEIGKDETEKLNNLVLSEGVTIYMVLLALFNIFLAKMSGQEEVVVGSPTAGRKHLDLEQIIGMFVITLALKNYPAGEKTVNEFLREIKEKTLAAQENQDYPFEDLVENVVLDRDASRNPLFDTMFVMQNIGIPRLEIPGLKLAPYKHQMKTAKFDLTLIGMEVEEKLLLTFEYSSNLFKKETIERFIAYFKKIVSLITQKTERKISEIEIILEKEKRQILLEFNNKEARYPTSKTLQQLFEEQAEKTPDAAAVVYEGEAYSFKQLDKKSNQLAHYLGCQGVRKNQLLGIMVERSLDMIVGILGILKANCAYVPINPQSPTARTMYILKECNVKILLSQSHLGDHRKDFGNCLFIDAYKHYCHIQDTKLQGKGNHQDFAYVIFTSGSTGKPKGVPITHANLSPLLHWGYKHLRLDSTDRVIQNLSYYFDWSVWEIFITLTSGAVLHFASDEILLNPGTCIEFINRNMITVLHATPSQYQYLVNEGQTFETLKYLFIGAEKLTFDLVQRSFASVNKGCRVFNMYGPTEATIISTVLETHRSEDGICSGLSSVPIGEPIANAGVMVLDKYLKFCPVNVIGELYISGDGLARGYLSDPGKTFKSFIPNPYESMGIPGVRLYKTGDLVRWLSDGNIEFLGRRDHQVKIRGYRIELGEIERQLLQHPKITDSVVLARENHGDRYLCAYVVADEKTDVSELKDFLSNQLPGYMIPAYFVWLDKLPLAPGGKIHRSALPEPEIKAVEEYIAPRNRVEEKLAELWSEVLEVEKSLIGIDTNFFQLGGHSLKITSLLAKIHRAFDVKLPMAEVFKNPRIRELARYIKGLTSSQSVSYESIEPVEKRDYYELSSTQRRLFILQQMEDGNTTSYNMPYAIPLEKEINKEKLESAFVKLIHRHESLRTSFEIVSDSPVQRVHDSVDFAIDYIGAPGLTHELSSRNAQEIIANFMRPFDLSGAPLLRVGMVKTVEGKYLLLLDMHHIITDGTSQNILEREFWALYSGEESAPPRLHYKDYSVWQTSPAQEELIQQQEAFWVQEFSHDDELPVLNLAADYPRPLVQSFEGSSVHFVFTGKETRALTDMAKVIDGTLYMCILSVYTVLLSKMSGDENIIVGTPIAARRHAEIERIIGMFANTLAMRNYPASQKTFKEFLIEVKERTLKAFDHQEYPFEELVEKVPIQRDISRNPIFDVMFNLLNRSEAPVDSPMVDTTDEQEGNKYEHRKSTSKFDLNLTAADNNGKRLHFNFEYCTKLFKASTIERMIRYFRRIVALLSENIELKLSDLEIMTGEERAKVLEMSMGIEEAIEPDKTIPDWFEDQAAKSPDNIALVGQSPGCAITYKELNERSNQLARVLMERGASPGTVVGLMVERSFEMISGILAILKAGGAYLPIDKEYPEERKNYMLKDSQVKLLLTNDNREDLPGAPSQEIEMITINNEDIYCRDNRNPQPMNTGSNLIYVIYTSGSTGKPKGVMLEHRNLVNLVRYQYKHTNLDFSSVLQFATISFDVSAQEIFSTLLAGGKLSLIDNETRNNIPGLFTIIEKNDITTLFLPTAFLKFIFKEEEYVELFPANVKHIAAAGERLMISDHLKGYLQVNHVYLHNHYGPTETHVVTSLTLDPKEEIPEIPSIGKPILNTTIFILDKGHHLQPIGIPGELYIGGIQVGRGYLGKEHLTAERFIANPFGEGERIYKTGDLARWLSDGNIEFLDRIDHQVKIRGFRVELEEIERQLLQHNKINESVVLAREDNEDRYLCAYVAADEKIDVSELRDFLANKLPGYMIPAYFVSLDKLPLTPNGKIHRKALPVPVLQVGDRYVAPGSEMEEQLVEIWSEVLGTSAHTPVSIGIDDNFFQLGGHSLKATILISKLHKTLNVKVPLAEIFKKPTIRGLCKYIEAKEKDRYTAVEKTEKKEYYRLSSAQKRLYILQQMDLKSINYNMSGVFIIEGKWSRKKFEKACQNLINRHEVLRTSFQLVNGEAIQRIDDQVEFQISCKKMNAEEDVKNQIKEFVKPFDLSKAPLFRVELIELAKEKNVVLLDIHHIISDGSSIEILINEFVHLYKGKSLTPLPVQYKDYTAWLNIRLNEEKLGEQQNYWLRKLEDFLFTRFPVDHHDFTGVEGKEKHLDIDSSIFEKIKKFCFNHNVTKFIFMITAFTIALSREIDQSDITIGIPVSIRKHSDLKHLIGIFLNVLLIRTIVDEEDTFLNHLAKNKKSVMEALNNQDYPYEILYDKVAGKIHLKNDELFSILFNYISVETNKEIFTDDFKIDTLETKNISPKYDMTLYVYDAPDYMALNLVYKGNIYDENSIKYLLDSFSITIQSVLENENMSLSQLSSGTVPDEPDENDLDAKFEQYYDDDSSDFN
ncbi:amino acid adenylation domain-containing protein [Acidobacteriota bacterium]